MKPCHAVALALVGWCLMLPPVERVGTLLLVTGTEPLNLWSIEQTFSSENECHKALADLKQSHIYSGRGNTEFEVDQQRQHAICVATDDPRLKPN
jgi:hypothetical protein